jgi:hypothetical protein
LEAVIHKKLVSVKKTKLTPVQKKPILARYKAPCIYNLLVAMKTDGNGRKNPISTSVSIFFGGNGIGFGKYGFENEFGICGHTETNKYG